MSWEISKVSTPERIFKKINEEMEKPVAVMLIGAESELKNGAARQWMLSKLNGAAVKFGGPDAELDSRAVEALKKGENVLLDLKGPDCATKRKRKKAVDLLRENGAASVVAIWAKCGRPTIKNVDIDQADQAVKEVQARYRQVKAFAAYPPTADEFDYLITVHGE